MAEEETLAKDVSSGHEETQKAESSGKIPDFHELSMDKLSFWKEVSQNKITVKLLDEKTSTNRIYKVDIWDESGSYVLKTLLVKKFTILGSTIDDGNTQIQVFETLGEHGLGARVVYRSDDTLIKDFIEGSCLENDSFMYLPTLVSLASSLAKFHKFATGVASPNWDRTPRLFKNIEAWIPRAREVVKEYDNYIDIEKLIGYFGDMRAILEKHFKESPAFTNNVRFCHNDLYCKNILETTSGIRLIDYDYSGFNYVGFDVSQIFNQVHIFFDPNDPKKFMEYTTLDLPLEMKRFFVSVYLSEALERNVMLTDKLVDEFLASLRIHTLGLGVFWSFAGIILLGTSKQTPVLPPEFLMRYSHVFCGLYEKTLQELKDLGVVN
ncbi:choline/ethanolamine kinase, putative [Theileria equi strain WA]|uniref:Choline/ethanolamine kinase, putative n=1 Tax=Theileria equi strain WA TaxID=1537102 RepID=L1LBT4_THEEQ|nr:choline/ethanolamine kinase, putative [Theileria equi strain WA]EKX72776.1 choline/ethanolamine kinase, putative [Theileria equi strain WA]|eukprot:XP_004832228.1 choline/ethanolamine kinase, putative [Theileria equi strain WA]